MYKTIVSEEKQTEMSRESKMHVANPFSSPSHPSSLRRPPIQNNTNTSKRGTGENASQDILPQTTGTTKKQTPKNANAIIVTQNSDGVSTMCLSSCLARTAETHRGEHGAGPHQHGLPRDALVQDRLCLRAGEERHGLLPPGRAEQPAAVHDHALYVPLHAAHGLQRLLIWVYANIPARKTSRWTCVWVGHIFRASPVGGGGLVEGDFNNFS